MTIDNADAVRKVLEDALANEPAGLIEQLIRHSAERSDELAAAVAGREFAFILGPVDPHTKEFPLALGVDGHLRLSSAANFEADLRIWGAPNQIAALLVGDLHPLMAFYQKCLTVYAELTDLTRYQALVGVLAKVAVAAAETLRAESPR